VTGPRQKTTDEALAALIDASLVLWGQPGEVRRCASGAISVRTPEHSAEISRAEPGIPFRWSSIIDGRQRHAGSISGLLRILRLALDEGFQPSRVRIAPVEVDVA
jgi:hypothetical protein